VGGGCPLGLAARILRAIADGEPRLSLSPEPGPSTVPASSPADVLQSGGVVDLYVEPVPPRPPALRTSLAARTLARIGHAMGYRIDVVDPEADQSAYPHAERILAEVPAEGLPRGAYVLVATMSERDLEAIEAAVRFAPAYLGLISSRIRLADLRKTLLARGVAPEALDRIAAPAGLDIGARSPEEIALSVMAQIVSPAPRRGKAEARAPVAARGDRPIRMTVAVAGASTLPTAGRSATSLRRLPDGSWPIAATPPPRPPAERRDPCPAGGGKRRHVVDPKIATAAYLAREMRKLPLVEGEAGRRRSSSRRCSRGLGTS
jgi:xanthine dehydrogenase accessory factor